MRAWLQAARPLAQVNIAVPLLVGEALAIAQTGRVDWTLLVFAHVVGVLDHLFIVFANDVADEEGDRDNTTFNAFSGGSRVLAQGKLSAPSLWRAALVAATLMVLATAAGALAFDRPWFLPGISAAVALMWGYSYSPLRLAYRGFGEAAQGLGVGVLLPLFGYYAQTGDVHGFMWPALVPLFLLGFTSNIATGLPDHPADLACDKRSWAVRYGPARARKHCLQLMAIAILLTPLVLPGADRTTWLLVEAVPAALLLANVLGLRSADADSPRACYRFVFLCGSAANAAMLGWIIALVI